MWQVLARSDKILQDMTIYDKIWHYLTIYDKIWKDMTRYDNMCTVMPRYGKEWSRCAPLASLGGDSGEDFNDGHFFQTMLW